jgi:uncharacterized protein (TIGR00369 family)
MHWRRMLGKGESSTTIELKTNYFRPTRQGKLIAVAKVIKAGITPAYIECEIKNEADKLVAKSAGTCMKLRETRS